MKILNDIGCNLIELKFDSIQLKRNEMQIVGEDIENLLVNMVGIYF
jgi:hypothetical protein